MKIKALTLVLVTSALLAPTGDAAPSMGTAAPVPVPKPKIGTSPTPSLKQAAKLTVVNAAAVPGETRTLEARMTFGSDTPVVGKRVEFQITKRSDAPPSITSYPEIQASRGGMILAGSGTTDATGKVRVAFKMPVLPQGSYRLRAVFDGDAEVGATSGEGNLGAVKGITKLDLSDVVWGPNGGRVTFTLRRTSDNALIVMGVASPSTAPSITVKENDSAPVPQGTHDGTLTWNLRAKSAKSWTVKGLYFGDAAYQGVEVQRTYPKP